MSPRDRARHVCLAALLAAAVAALAFSYENVPAWGLLLLPAAATLVALPAVPARIASTLTLTAHALTVGAGIVVANGFFQAAPALGFVLAVLAGVFLLAARSFPTTSAFLPAALAVLLLASANPAPRHLESLVWGATAALVLWVGLSTGTRRAARVTGLALFVIAAAAIGEGIMRFLPWAQPHVESVAYRFIAPDEAQSGVALGGHLGSVEQLALSRRRLLRVWSEEPASLRVGVYTHFDGHRWGTPKTAPDPTTLVKGPHVDAPEEWTRVLPGEWVVDPAARRLESGRLMRVVVEAPFPGVLPAPASTHAVRLVEASLRMDGAGVILGPPRPAALYGLRHLARPASDPLDAAQALQLPSLDPRIVDLSRALGPPEAAVSDKIARTVGHLHSNYRYALKVGKWKTRDPLAEFLFDKKQGYCEYFATAAVVLLRLQGVPARYVSGLNLRDENYVHDHYLVRGADAHAWAEAHVAEVGWVAVDATPPDQYAAMHAGLKPGWLERQIEALKARWASLVARVREGGWGALGAAVWADVKTWGGRPWTWLALTALTAVLVRRRRRRASPPSSIRAVPDREVDPDVRACLDRLERLWARAGWPRPAHRALLEHARTLPDEHASLRSLSVEVVDCFYRDAYGGLRVPSEDVARLMQAMAAIGRRGEVQDTRHPGL